MPAQRYRGTTCLGSGSLSTSSWNDGADEKRPSIGNIRAVPAQGRQNIHLPVYVARAARISGAAISPSKSRAREVRRQKHDDVAVAGGSFELVLPVNSIVTITSLLDAGSHGTHPPPPKPTAFPLPYSEDFEGYPKDDSNIARYFADMSGAFEVVGGVLKQRTPQVGSNVAINLWLCCDSPLVVLRLTSNCVALHL